MKPHKDNCKECGEMKWISNARNLCDNCVYKTNHGGKTMFEVATERGANKPVRIYRLKQTALKSNKKGIRSTKETKEKRKEILRKDRELYFYIFSHTPHKCEECGSYLPDTFEDENGNMIYISQYSHILSKGAYPEHRHNVTNINRLCSKCHDIWEFGDKEKMKIFTKNEEIIQNLFNLSK